VPFLHRAILIELLKIYPGAAQIEKKYEAFAQNDPDPVSVIKIILGSSNKLKNNALAFLNYNTGDVSEAVYLQLRALIDLAIKYNKIETWVKVIEVAGEGGYHTFMNSLTDSKLSRASFALLMYIRNQVDNKVKSIDDRIKTYEEKPGSVNGKLSLEEKVKLYKVVLDADEELALKIHLSINEKIAIAKKLIQAVKQVNELSDGLELSMTIGGKIDVNTKEEKEYLSTSLKKIERTQRRLFFLGDTSFESNPDLKPEDIFSKFEFYTADQLRKDYNLPNNQMDSSLRSKLRLPIFLQRIYPSLYIRSQFKDPKYSELNENQVIESFEQLVLINIVKRQSAIHESKERIQTPVSQTKSTLVVDTEPLSPALPITTQQVEVMRYFNQPSPVKHEQTEIKPGNDAISHISSSELGTTGLFNTKSNTQPNLEPVSTNPNETVAPGKDSPTF